MIIVDVIYCLLVVFINKNKVLVLGVSYVCEIIYYVFNGLVGYVLSGLIENGYYVCVVKVFYIIYEKYVMLLNVE